MCIVMDVMHFGTHSTLSSCKQRTFATIGEIVRGGGGKNHTNLQKIENNFLVSVMVQNSKKYQEFLLFLKLYKNATLC